ncbi:RdgB/HAM1 family non-canonical purine NTP pyrophosphatase [Alcanivorax sp. JB21]|uniref:RdgB/HAM1 family non-canonical purine NTP pyrophosphatase n=1 Tax=Alcanivorax limicola TaxID=2874102 RepID=UPI001CBE9343|nr:RdgB/HAM1 family non-canonical purine NTP pyrophosphatase [Alcanivorax limicola]MBZ2188801.1 RdgB/HAM1 family non-canonical purine NTP pyrophosphatase [Alcanivorax limicola]
MDMVLASGNQKKLRELADILQPLGIRLLPQSEFGVPEADETGLTFVENAIIKARNAAMHTGLPAISDDSGLEVDALKGAPGIYSARFAGPDASDADNNAELVRQLRASVSQADSTDTFSARYQCVIVFMRHAEDPVPIICQGSWEGAIHLTPQGHGGFGYDPHFFAHGAGCSAAEMSATEKHRLSHRGKALADFMAVARQRLPVR